MRRAGARPGVLWGRGIRAFLGGVGVLGVLGVLRSGHRSLEPAAEGPREWIRSQALAMLGDTRREIVQADQKASILLAAVGAVASVCLGTLFGNQWSPARLASPWEELWWTGVIALAVALFLFVMVVFPRFGTGRRPQAAGVASFLDVVRCADEHELHRSLERAHAADIGAVLRQLHQVSRIVYRKYLLLRGGLLLLVFAAVCSTAAVLSSVAG